MPSRRAAAIGLGFALAIGLVALLAGALTTRSRIVNTTGVLPIYPVAPIDKGDETCQTPIGLGDEVRELRLHIGTFGKPGPPMTVTVREARTGRSLGTGDIAGGWIDNGTPKDVPIGSVPAGLSVSACVRNEGDTPAYVYGNYYAGRVTNGPIGVTPTISTSFATVDGREIQGDLSLEFVSAQPRSLISRLPSAFRHASVFRPSIVGSWLFWLMLALAVIGAPAALWWALKRAIADESENTPLP